MSEKIFRQLEKIDPSAVRNLPEGLEETPTVDRLGIGAVLRRKLSAASVLLEAEKKFRRIKGYQEILLLEERLNPSRTPQKEVLTAEVACTWLLGALRCKTPRVAGIN